MKPRNKTYPQLQITIYCEYKQSRVQQGNMQDLDRRLQNLNRIRHRILISPGHALPLVSGKKTSADDPYVILLHDVSESGLQYRRSSLKCKAYSYTEPGADIIGSMLVIYFIHRSIRVILSNKFCV